MIIVYRLLLLFLVITMSLSAVGETRSNKQRNVYLLIYFSSLAALMISFKWF